jgi:dienelactone hydrolase
MQGEIARLITVFSTALLLGAGACNAKPADKAAPPVQARAAAEPLTLRASDSVVVHGNYYPARNARALILLFHQAGSSKDEYATIAPQLVKAGYSALAIDQRSGDGMFGTNETAAALGRKADYLEARPDLKAALDWARNQKLPIILWGSSYSSSLIFPLAAGDAQDIVALLAFSPGEYFDDKQMIRSAAAKVKVPVFVASANTKDETGEADPIMAALPKSNRNVRFVPVHGVHGSSMLIANRNPAGAEENMRAVLKFLDRVVPPR